MNKTLKYSLIALAAFGACQMSFAQSSVTLSGTIKAGVAATQYKNQSDQDKPFGWSVNDGASRFALSGKEDLGSGWFGVFQIENRFRSDESPLSAEASGETFVGLQSKHFGSLRLGKFDTHYCYGSDEHENRATARQASNCALLAYVQQTPIANASRASNMLRFDLPNLAGFSGNLSWSPSWQGSEAIADAGKGYAAAAQIAYQTPMIWLGGSFWKAKSEDRSLNASFADQSAQTFLARLTIDSMLGSTNVGFTVDKSTLKQGAIGQLSNFETKRTAWSVPLSHIFGAHTFLLTYTKADRLKLDKQTLAESGADLWSIGYDYALSKRTSLGVSYVQLNNQTLSNYALYTQQNLGGLNKPMLAQDQRQLYVGLKHSF